MNPKSKIPESEKMIIVYNDDFMGDYTIKGKFIDYKKPIKKGKKTFKSRFCVFDESTQTWVNEQYEFSTSKGWTYDT